MLIGIGVGVLLFGLIRFMAQPDDTVHYHANFAVIINGQREEFKGAQYYEEIASCSSKETPQSRVHMHDTVSHIVHVHDRLVTWSNFFTVLGWSLSDRAIVAGNKAYVDGDGGNLRFVLNGKPVLSIANEVIKSEDRLLIDFGNEDAAQMTEAFEQVESDARLYNQRKDPSTCKGPEELSVWSRLQRAFWF